MKTLLIGFGSALVIYIIFLLIDWRIECWKRKVLGAEKGKDYGNVDRCVVCGDPIPEGRQVCSSCEKLLKKGDID